jgi:signal transduction histidine kinase
MPVHNMKLSVSSPVGNAGTRAFIRLVRCEGNDMLSPGTPRAEAPPPRSLDQMQHDIRTPLGTVLSLADLIAATASTPRQRQLAETLKSSSEDLRRELDALFAVLPPAGNS